MKSLVGQGIESRRETICGRPSSSCEDLGRSTTHKRATTTAPLRPPTSEIAAFSRECLKRGLAVVTVGFPATPIIKARGRRSRRVTVSRSRRISSGVTVSPLFRDERAAAVARATTARLRSVARATTPLSRRKDRTPSRRSRADGRSRDDDASSIRDWTASRARASASRPATSAPTSRSRSARSRRSPPDAPSARELLRAAVTPRRVSCERRPWWCERRPLLTCCATHAISRSPSSASFSTRSRPLAEPACAAADVTRREWAAGRRAGARRRCDPTTTARRTPRGAPPAVARADPTPPPLRDAREALGRAGDGTGLNARARNTRETPSVFGGAARTAGGI